MNKSLTTLTVTILALFLVGCGSDAPSTKNLEGKTMTVSYSPSCTCCKNYIDYLESNGINVEKRTMSRTRLNMVKSGFNLKEPAFSCHTAKIDGYLVEGHVPVEAIAKLLKDQPDDVQGITVPGMPRHSPGMGKPAGKDLPVKSVNDQGQITGTYTEVYY